MHLLLGLSSIIFFVGGGVLSLRLLRHQRSWDYRRWVQGLVLVLPLASLILGLVGLHHFAGQPCLSNAPWWDAQFELVLPLVMGIMVLGALGLDLFRLLLLQRVVRCSSITAGRALQARVDALAAHLHAPRTLLRLCSYDRPLALTTGTLRPTILLSTWMVEQLDQRELEGVLAHEIEHVARRDYPLMWLATFLRDAFFYLPTSWKAYQLLQQEKEVACDERAIAMTHQPLALASALTKVWLNTVEEPGTAFLASVPHLVKAGEPINGRIERLLAPVQSINQIADAHFVGRRAIRWEMPALFGLMLLELGNVILMLGLMGCGPVSVVSKLF